MRSMGYVDLNVSMESKRVDASPSPGRSLSSLRGQTRLKSSPFCPESSSRMTQSIIEDHMLSHYKKVYSAKAAIDASVPKSMTHSVKYNDQRRREQLKKGARPQSARSLSQRDGRASCSSAQSRRSVPGEESPYLFLERSMVSSPRPSTSFHAKQIAYASNTAPRTLRSHAVRPTSELSYRSPAEANGQHSSARRLYSASGTQERGYQAFQDPVQKTYSGDLLQTHAHYFTHDQRFTPRTLKSDKSSYLSKYRYYTAPRRRPEQDHTNPHTNPHANPRLLRQETYHGSTQTKEYSSTEFDDPPQGFSTEHEWSDDESNGLNVSSSRQRSKTTRSRGSDFYHSSSRVSPEGMKSPITMRVSTEEEELIYLEFIEDVTNDILTRGLFSDRVLDRVFQRHIDMNMNRLDEEKMRHLLEVLRKDLEHPVNTPPCSAGLEITGQNELLHRHRHTPSQDPPARTKHNHDDLLPYASFVKDSRGSLAALSLSTPLGRASPETSLRQEDLEGLQDGAVGSPRLSQSAEEDKEDVPVADDCEDHRPNCENTAMPGDGDDAPPLEPAGDGRDGPSAELEDLGRRLSESLFVSDRNEDQETDETQHRNTFVSLSDDDDF